MKLVFLSHENLQNSLFIKDLAFNYQLNEGSILVHEPFGKTIADTRFVTKRLSALMSEAMVVNNYFSGDQKQILTVEQGEVKLNTEFLKTHLALIPVVLLNTVAATAEGPQIVDPFEVMDLLKAQFEVSETFVFTRNARSPLASQKSQISEAAEVERLEKIYDEERTALRNALRLSPATLVSPLNFNR